MSLLGRSTNIADLVAAQELTTTSGRSDTYREWAIPPLGRRPRISGGHPSVITAFPGELRLSVLFG
jgi:hypothetical protein